LAHNVAELFDLTSKVALVTGAGSGLGRAFSEGLASVGARVVCADRDRGRADETAAAINGKRNDALSLHADVADPQSVEAMAEQVAQSCGRIDVLVNNAGIATMPLRIHEMPVEDWDRLMAINLRGVFLCSRAMIPLMLASGGGSIINIASIIGLVGHYPGFAANGANYAAAKAGTIGFTRQLAAEYAKDNIRANAIAPVGMAARGSRKSAKPKRRPRKSRASKKPFCEARRWAGADSPRNWKASQSIWRATPRVT